MANLIKWSCLAYLLSASCQPYFHSYCCNSLTQLRPIPVVSGRVTRINLTSDGFQTKTSKFVLSLQLSWTCPCSPVQQRCWVSAKRPTRHPAPFLSGSTNSRGARLTTRPPLDRSLPPSIKYQVSVVSNLGYSHKNHPPWLKLLSLQMYKMLQRSPEPC